MSPPFSVVEQVRLVVWLRWRIFRHSLESLGGRVDAISTAVLWLLMGGLVLGGGAAFALAAHHFLSTGHAAGFAGLFWAALLFWQFYPLLAGMKGPQFEFELLLRFPLRYVSFFTLSLAYGLVDPAAVGPLFWLCCLALGAGIARPGLFPLALVVCLLFAAMNLFLARAVSTWADRWMSRRRTREILGLLFILLVLLLQFAVPLLSEWSPGRRAAQLWLGPLHPVLRVLPPDIAARSLASGAAAAWLASLAALFILCLYAAAFLLLLHARLHAQFRGENLGESSLAAPAARRAAVPRRASPLRLPWASGPTSALFGREVRYALRNWPVLFQFFLPAFFLAVLSPSLRQSAFLAHNRDVIFPLAVAYAFFHELNWCFNSLGTDGTGIRLLLLAPVTFRQVMAGKNLFCAAATLLNLLILWILVRCLFGPPGAAMTLITLLAALFALLVNFAVGNALSLRFPRRVPIGGYRGSRGPSGTAVLAGLITEVALIASGAVVIAFGKFLNRPGLSLLIFFVFSAIAAFAYFVCLGQIDRLALTHRDTLLEELCRPAGQS